MTNLINEWMFIFHKDTTTFYELKYTNTITLEEDYWGQHTVINLITNVRQLYGFMINKVVCHAPEDTDEIFSSICFSLHRDDDAALY